MAKRICSVPDCERTHYAKDLCSAHYGQMRRGEVVRPIRLFLQGATLRERIENYLEPQPDGCWLWTRARHPLGYGLVRWNGKLLIVHRAYLIELGYHVPDDMDVDHLCRVTSCANPDHLEVVTHRENLLRGVGVSALNARKTHCPQGHEYTAENTNLYKGWRYCRICKRDRNGRR